MAEAPTVCSGATAARARAQAPSVAPTLVLVLALVLGTGLPRAALGQAAAAPVASAAATHEAQPVSADPALEARVMAIAAELRCLVCQNQTIADSMAGLAVDLRQQIREMLQKGLDERQITDYMTARYGDFVRYRPPFKASTALLWLGPAALLAVALGTLFALLRRRQRLGAEAFDPDQPDPTDPADLRVDPRAPPPGDTPPR